MEATEYFKSGHTCSESIIKWAIDEKLCSQELLKIATPFSGGMSCGCLCGAVAAGQMVIGSKFSGNEAKQKAFILIDEFKKRNKYTCCKLLTQGVENRKEHCTKMVSNVVEIIKEMLGVKVC